MATKRFDFILDDVKHKLIEERNGTELRWTTHEPCGRQTPAIVAHIIENDVAESHFEYVCKDGKKRISSVTNTGSIYVPASGGYQFPKPSSSTVDIFPLNPTNCINLKTNGRYNTGSTFNISVNGPTWLIYAATTSGTITSHETYK